MTLVTSLVLVVLPQVWQIKYNTIVAVFFAVQRDINTYWPTALWWKVAE